MARFTKTLWGLANRLRSILSLATEWSLETASRRTPAPGRDDRSGELGAPSCGWQYCSSASTCSRSEKGALNPESSLSPIQQVQHRESLGRSVGGFSTKIHLRCDGNGRPITFMLTVGERHEAVVFQELMEQGQIRLSGPGRPRIRPHRIIGDKAYNSQALRSYLRRRGIRYTIPRKSNQRSQGRFDKALYRQRNHVERCFNRLKQYRRIATRYEKKGCNYLAMLTIACIMLWI